MKRTKRAGKQIARTQHKNNEGRPSKYYLDYSTAEMAYQLALLGATDEQLAAAFDTTIQTIQTWRQKHPEFLASLKCGKVIADAQIANSLFHRAKGYSHPDSNISIYKGEVIVTPITKHYPPDTTACIFWLKNRQSALWRDTHRTEVTGANGQPIKQANLHMHRLDLSSLTDDELAMVKRVGLKLLPAANGDQE